ncbi:UDP-glycosyltransferase 85C1 [Lactuca sativa]|uniref:Glycosyltransferase n=1 Tax=Lactuca sativa TaxID=4236 RepID=A0A9R1WTS3_LACSA|nr:UDP-glycosyltransferase 85C1 [Lactuca sativa]KAJ0228023.1 hypothetical protein LSAT_V11C100010740 [Lactuca sativa]
MDPESRIDEKKPHVLFIPFPAQSHIKCMLKLARLLHHKGLHITFVNTESSHNRLLKYGGLHGLDTAPGFQFKTVPDGLPSDDDTELNQTAEAERLFVYLSTNFLGSFLDLVARLESPPTCIISDGFMTFTDTVNATAEKLKIPIILYWTLAACGFMAYYQTKVLTDKGLLPLKDESYLNNGYIDTLIDWIPGMEGVRFRDLPKHMLATSADDPAYNYLLESARTADKVSHVILHTFDELEATLVKELKSIFPRIYTVGPLQLLLNQTNQTKSSSFNGYSLWNEEPECIEWLESKEPNSVLYVNFGSLAVMSLQELLELGWGLVNSNHYFLWIIRTDMVDGGSAILPLEFEDAVKTRGFIANWCSQEEVLNHPSVGGFLTHGGWGSVIESLSAGVPMLCWPVSHDQMVNCRQMCQNWGVGMEIERNSKRDEVEKLVKALMEGIEGKRMRKKAMEWKKMAEIATDCNGCSSLNIEDLVNEITNMSTN